jgi:hypothetical protein
MTDFFKKIYREPFKRYLLIFLAILGVILLFTGQEATQPAESAGSGVVEVHFFYHSGCSHCKDQYSFNEKLAQTYPSVCIIYHDGANPGEYALLTEMIAGTGVTEEQLDFPVTIIGGRVFIGWESEETTGKKIEEALQQCLAGNCQEAKNEEPKDEVDLPLVGKVNVFDYSIPALAVILGLVDGFNPCAMWVLVYLISLIMVLNDKKKAWLLVGSFVFASGVWYFLFMTAWLNAFLLIGYSRPVTVVIGLVALGAGVLNVREFIKTKGAIVCEVVDAESRQRAMTRIERIVSSPLNVATIAGIIALAFVVNSMEFVCSAALPAIFTRVLSLSSLSMFQYYAYILLYDFFFMLDDLIIFGSAAFAMNSSLGDRYAKYCRPLGGAILLALGIMLLFAPNLLP